MGRGKRNTDLNMKVNDSVSDGDRFEQRPKWR